MMAQPKNVTDYSDLSKDDQFKVRKMVKIQQQAKTLKECDRLATELERSVEELKIRKQELCYLAYIAATCMNLNMEVV